MHDALVECRPRADVVDEIRLADASINCACLVRVWSQEAKTSKFIDLGYRFEQGVAKLVPPINMLHQTGFCLQTSVPMLAAESKVSVELVCGLVDDDYRHNLVRSFRQLYPNGKALQYRRDGLQCD